MPRTVARATAPAVSAANPLSGVPLDRAAERRTDVAWFAAVVAAAATRVMPVCEGRVLVIGGVDGARACMPTVGALRAALGTDRSWPDPVRPVVLLGVDPRGNNGPLPYVAADVAPEDAERVAALAGAAEGGAPHERASDDGASEEARWSELRPAALTLPAPEAALVAYARAMVWWHSRHGFCGVCGGPTVSAEAGHVRACTRCDARHFPRTDPAVIVLVSSPAPDGDPAGEACLLGNAPAWPAAMYSTLAGFVEPGETLEEAVRCEVLEEAGVRVGEVAYHSSQPWPFPQSLMLGFTATAAPGAPRGAVRVDGVELRDARWFTRAELEAALADGSVRISSPLSISRRLIDGWRAGAGPG